MVLLHFEEDVDIQKTNFSNCVFVDSDLGSPHITDTILNYSQFTSLVYTDNSKIVNCSFGNTNIIATSTPVQIEWPTIVLHMPGSVISTLYNLALVCMHHFYGVVLFQDSAFQTS